MVELIKPFQWRENPGNWSLSYITWVAGGVCNSRKNIDLKWGYITWVAGGVCNSRKNIDLKWGGNNEAMSLTEYTASADVNNNGLVKSSNGYALAIGI